MAAGARAFDWINGIVALVFLFAGGLQLNDPDPWPWIVVYALAAGACLVHGRVPRDRLPPIAVGLASLVWALSILPRLGGFRFGDLFQTMKAGTPTIELSREFLGLLIIAGWMVVLILRRRPS